MSDFLELESLKVGHGRLCNTFVQYLRPDFYSIEKLSWKVQLESCREKGCGYCQAGEKDMEQLAFLFRFFPPLV